MIKNSCLKEGEPVTEILFALTQPIFYLLSLKTGIFLKQVTAFSESISRWIFRNHFPQCSRYASILAASFSCVIICSILCWRPVDSGCYPEIATSCHFQCERLVFFNSRHLTTLSPLPVGAQMAAKGMLE